MAYFSNGSEGECYFEHYCSRCLHDNVEKGINCPIWGLHLLYNYAECNKADSFLHTLIPRRKDGGNAQCSMFVDRNALSNLAIQKIESDMIEAAKP